MSSNALLAASVAVFAVLAVATPMPPVPPSVVAHLVGDMLGHSKGPLASRQSTNVSQCNTGTIQCCNSTQYVNTTQDATDIYSLVGVVVQDLGVLVGMGCSPASVVGVGGNQCAAKPVCCEDNSYGSLISLDCVPVEVDL